MARKSPQRSATSFRTASGSPGPDAQFWVAHVVGADIPGLERLGFLTFFPVVDDYVFLEALEENSHYLQNEDVLGLEFLRTKGGLTQIPWKDLQGMSSNSTVDVKKIGPGSRVEVVRGVAEGLDGEVVEITAKGIRVAVEGYRRTYEVLVDGSEIVLVKSGS